MAKEKKRLSKAAKAAQKILEESKLLAAKATNDLKTTDHFKPADTLPKPSSANKLRPEKKRG
jgi:hypothetical protein